MGEPEQRETMTERFYRQKREEDHFNFVFFFVIFWIASAYWLFTFFTNSIPVGEYFTNPVKVYDQSNKEYSYMNLIVGVDRDDDGKYYYVSEIIRSNGKLVEVDSDRNSLGQPCDFGMYDGPTRSDSGRLIAASYLYRVTINPKDIQISPLERIENDLLGFAIRIVLFAFFSYTLYKDHKSKKNPGN